MILLKTGVGKFMECSPLVEFLMKLWWMMYIPANFCVINRRCLRYNEWRALSCIWHAPWNEIQISSMFRESAKYHRKWAEYHQKFVTECQIIYWLLYTLGSVYKDDKTYHWYLTYTRTFWCWKLNPHVLVFLGLWHTPDGSHVISPPSHLITKASFGWAQL